MPGRQSAPILAMAPVVVLPDGIALMAGLVRLVLAWTVKFKMVVAALAMEHKPVLMEHSGLVVLVEPAVLLTL